jgi:hypothetical protein
MYLPNDWLHHAFTHPIISPHVSQLRQHIVGLVILNEEIYQFPGWV